MRDLVQLALPSKNVHPRAERAGPRGGERSFSDALQIKLGKSGAVAGREPEVADAPSPLAAAFRIRIDSRGMTTGLPVATALRGDHPGVAAQDGEPAIDTDDLEDMAEEIAAGESTPDAVLLETATQAEPEPLDVAHEVSDPEAMIAVPAQVPAPINGNGAEAPVVASALRLEPGSRLAHTQTGADEPDALESQTPRMAAAEAGKAASRPGMVADTATAKASLAADVANPARVDAEAKPAIDHDRTSRGAPQMPVGESRSEMPRIPANVRVVEAQSFPAPPQMPPPSASVTSAIAAAPDWMSFVRNPADATLAASSSGAAPIKSLTIQLHPAELGAVTAKLRFAGEQLTIELQVDRTEAYDRLSTDRESMLKAVRALGIEVDRITIQQPQATNAANARSENGPAFNHGGGREPGFSAPGGSGGRDGGGPGNPQGGTGRDDAPGQHPGAGPGHQNRDGRGLYI